MKSSQSPRFFPLVPYIALFALIVWTMGGCAGETAPRPDAPPTARVPEAAPEPSRPETPPTADPSPEKMRPGGTPPPSPSPGDVGAPESSRPGAFDSSPESVEKPAPPEETAEERAEDRLPDQRVFLDMRNVELGLLLRTLARIAGQNLVLSENVRGSASLTIENEAWRDVFLSLLRTYGLTYAWEGSIIRVMTAEDISKDFRLLELEQRRRAKKREIESVAPLETRVFNVRYGDVENLGEIFGAILEENADRRRGVVMVDTFTNSLVVRASRRELERIDGLLAALDRPTSQIRIEARIVEASSDTARELGIEWGGYYRAGSGDRNFWVAPGVNSFAGVADTGGVDGGNEAVASIQPTAGLIQQLPGILSEIRDGTGLNIGFIGERVGDYVLGVQLSALEKAGKLRLLSSPSISTLDNQTATIESGREVPFQTVDEGEVNVEFKEAVLRLEVTPHVIGVGTLKLRIVTNKDELDFSNTVDGNPTVITKRARTSVLLRDGQTTVIGGLRKETSSDSERGVPILMDLPLLGRLFRRDSRSQNQEEILIFITPRILESIETTPEDRRFPVPSRKPA